MSKRLVDISTFKRLVKEQGALAILGLVFTIIAGLTFIPVGILVSAFAKPYEKYDQQRIDEQGAKKTAKITFITEIYNVTVNGEHPRLISYVYQDQGSMQVDKCQTLDLEPIANWKVGDTIDIKVLGNESKIQGVEPFSFPFYIFYAIPLMLLLVGLAFLITGVWPALKRYNLYKNGDVYEASVVNMQPGRRGSIVSYFFIGSNGDEIFGESIGEYALLSEKRVNDKVKIFVDAQNENRSCLVPKAETIKYNWDI